MLFEGYDEAPRGTGQQCKPDYEKLIAEKRERLSLNLDLYDALIKYLKRKGLQPERLLKPLTLPEILGVLILEREKLEETINELIRQQEKAAKEKD